MIDLDQVVLRRAEEQALACADATTYERDWWRPKRLPAGLGRVKLRARCLAGDCNRRVVGRHGYCHAHVQKLRNGVQLDRDILGGWGRGARKAGSVLDRDLAERRSPASLATEAAHPGPAAPGPMRRAPSARPRPA